MSGGLTSETAAVDTCGLFGGLISDELSLFCYQEQFFCEHLDKNLTLLKKSSGCL